MPVFKRPGSDIYSYDFRYKGNRFSGSTECTSKRAAEKFEQERRERAKAELIDDKKPMTFSVALTRYWDEVGQHHANSDTTWKTLGWLQKAVGSNKLLSDIDDSLVAKLVVKRRIETVRGKKDAPTVKPSTVNRTCTQPLRDIMIRAKKVWKVPVQQIEFGEHLLDEPQERVREASVAEEAAIMEQLERGYDVAIEFAFLSGCRRMEILGLEWAHVDFFSRRFTVTGKGKKTRTIPMSDAIFNLLWGEKSHHPTKVFTFIAKRTLKKLGYVRGVRYPLRESGLKSAMRRAVPNAEVKNFRFHDTRHTAATRVLRSSNLRVAQKLLGHSDIKTTTKYAHALDDDIRNALNAVSSKNAAEINTHTQEEIAKRLKKVDNQD